MEGDAEFCIYTNNAVLAFTAYEKLDLPTRIGDEGW
jgi:hypothetical protein